MSQAELGTKELGDSSEHDTVGLSLNSQHQHGEPGQDGLLPALTTEVLV